jgi:hypothetical protein
MSREKFKEIRLKPETLKIIATADQIVRQYQAQGYRLTLRQLYYQFVSKNLITNEEKSYKKLASMISDGRLAGLLDWEGIEDRGREPSIPLQFSSLEHRVKAALDNYRLPRWEGQTSYCELWVEKQALAGVLAPLARQFHVTLCVNKGYSSQSAMYDAAQRFREGMGTQGEREDVGPNEDPWYNLESEREGHLFYLGDHDPSGEDMVRDIRDRMAMFGVHDLSVTKIALTMGQIREHNPPPNPAKISDPRATKYIEEHGESSWEVDALGPAILVQLIRDAFAEVIDGDAMQAVVERENRDKAELLKATASIMNRGGE